MNVALLSIVLASQLGDPLVIAVGDRVPLINVEETCKATAATDKAMGLDLPQSVENCMRDENASLPRSGRPIPLPFVIAARRKRLMPEQAAMLTS
jgi:hypothetical protein